MKSLRRALIYLRPYWLTALAAMLSLLLVTLNGYRDPEQAVRAMLVYGLYGAGGLAINFRWRVPTLSYVGLVLVSAATLWGLWWQIAAFTPVATRKRVVSQPHSRRKRTGSRYRPGFSSRKEIRRSHLTHSTIRRHGWGDNHGGRDESRGHGLPPRRRRKR